MALNWVMLDESKSPMPLPNENSIMTVENGADIVLDVPDVAGNPKKLRAIGKLWLTDQRLIFVATPGDLSFESLSVPLLAVLSTSFIQPTFSANYLAIEIKPSPQGGLTGGTKVEIRLKNQPMIGFVSALEKVRERALYMKRGSAMGDELPAYLPSSTSARPPATSAATQLPPTSTSTEQPSDAPPGYDVI